MLKETDGNKMLFGRRGGITSQKRERYKEIIAVTACRHRKIPSSIFGHNHVMCKLLHPCSAFLCKTWLQLLRRWHKKEIHCPSNFSSPFQPMSFFLPSKLMSVQQQFVALSFTVDVLEKCLLLLHPLLHVTAMMPPAALAQRLSPGGCIKGRKTPRAPQTMQPGGEGCGSGLRTTGGVFCRECINPPCLSQKLCLSHFYKSFFYRMPGRKEGAEQISRFFRRGPLAVRQRKPRQTQFLFPFIQQFLQRPFLSSPFPSFRHRKKKSLKVRIAAERTEERGEGKGEKI